eukprot:jgi/Galph1/5994/GphlegSOOS_G4564.1
MPIAFVCLQSFPYAKSRTATTHNSFQVKKSRGKKLLVESFPWKSITPCSKCFYDVIACDQSRKESPNQLPPSPPPSKFSKVVKYFLLFVEESKKEVKRFFVGDIYPIVASDIPKFRDACGTDTFFPIESVIYLEQIEFHGNLRSEASYALDKIQKRLDDMFGSKYMASLHDNGDPQSKPYIVISISNAEKQPLNRFRIIISCLCIISCLLKCLERSYLYCYHYQWNSSNIFLKYCIPFQWLGILLFHAIWIFLQRQIAKRYQTRLEFPFPIPSHIIGLWGFVSHMISSVPNRTALFDIASIGIGFALFLSLGVFLLGMYLSVLFPQHSTFFPTSILFSSLFTGSVARYLKGEQLIASGTDFRLVRIHPLAVLGTNALLVIGSHLLPLRNLDGYRILSSLYGRHIANIASRMATISILLGIFGNSYLFFFVLMVVFGPWKSDKFARNEVDQPDSFRTIAGYVSACITYTVIETEP